MYKEKEEEAGYAKIEGPDGIFHIIKALKLYLGRDSPSATSDLLPGEEFYPISTDSKVSKKHLLLFYDEQRREWYCKNLSKNKVFINKFSLTEDDRECRISPIASIQIKERNFYFFQAKPKSE